jgi:hypothetical protein
MPHDILALLPAFLPSHSDVWCAPECAEKAQQSWQPVRSGNSKVAAMTRTIYGATCTTTQYATPAILSRNSCGLLQMDLFFSVGQ